MIDSLTAGPESAYAAPERAPAVALAGVVADPGAASSEAAGNGGAGERCAPVWWLKRKGAGARPGEPAVLHTLKPLSQSMRAVFLAPPCSASARFVTAKRCQGRCGASLRRCSELASSSAAQPTGGSDFVNFVGLDFAPSTSCLLTLATGNK